MELRRVLPIGSLAAALVWLWAFTALQCVQILVRNHGPLSYTLDDAYIHMACAKNLALHGVFGVTPFEFSAAESSLAWPILLSGAFFVVRDLAVFLWIPLLVNLGLASTLLVHVWRETKSSGRDSWAVLCALAAVLIFAALPWLIFSGMEHLLQAVATLAFTGVLAGCLSGDPSARQGWYLAGLAALTTTARFEGVATVAVAVLLLLLRKRWQTAAGTTVAGAAPILLFSAVSVGHGGLWLPNSVLVKSDLDSAGGPIASVLSHLALALHQLIQRPYLLALLVVGVGLACLSRGTLWNRAHVFTIVFAASTIALLQGAVLPPYLGWVRYDAYLVVLGVVSVFLEIRLLRDRAGPSGNPAKLNLAIWMSAAALAAGFAASVKGRVEVAMEVPIAAHNIFAQQVQMARFVGRYDAGRSIALNDIGAVDYYNDIHLTDLLGLATTEVARARLGRCYHIDTIRSVTAKHGVEIAIAYTSAIASHAGGAPPEWTRIETWRIPGNVICGDETVTFYAVLPKAANELKRNLRNFNPELPKEVETRSMVK